MKSLIILASYLPAYPAPGPQPIPGLKEPMDLVLGYMIWGGLALALLSFVGGLLVLAGTIFWGWHISKKALFGIIIGVIAAFLIGSVSAISGVLIKGI